MNAKEHEHAERLDLTVVATGSWQHVCTKTYHEHDPWVYKIPAIYRGGVPIHQLPLAAPHDQPWRILFLGAVQVPFLVYRRLFRLALTGRAGRSTLSPLALAQRLLRSFMELWIALGTKLMAGYWKKTRWERFSHMLNILQDMEYRGLSGVALPYRLLVDRHATIRTDRKVMPYRGPILAQRKAETVLLAFQLFDDALDEAGASPQYSATLERHRWGEIAELQHRLWRAGIGLGHGVGALGPRHWGLLDGHIYLLDTSSLTTDRRLARRLLARRLSHAARILDKKKVATAQNLEYFAFMQQHLNVDRLDELWSETTPATGVPSTTVMRI